MNAPVQANLAWHRAAVTRARRKTLNGHKGAIVWFTGLSGAGKSTIAHAVEERLQRMDDRTFVFDGAGDIDVLRGCPV
jgi:adenylylsulfate kinase